MDPQLFALRRDFFALVPTNKLKFPEKMSLNRMNGFFMNGILLDSHFQKYSPSDQYQTSFWKWAIQQLEELACNIQDEEEDEIVSPIYEHYVSLMSLPKWRTTFGTLPLSPSYATYFWLLAEFEGMDAKKEVPNVDDYFTATLLESRTMIERGTTGLRTWYPSFPLARYLIQNPGALLLINRSNEELTRRCLRHSFEALVVSKSVLELGSGIGFLGIIVASLQQMGGQNQTGTLWLTDINDEVLERCRENLRLPCNPSSSHPSVNYIKLDWCDSIVNAESPSSLSITTLIEETIQPDLVIGADIVFDPSLIPGLVGTIKICLERHASCALIALAVRNKSTLSCFLSHLQESSLHAEEVVLPVAQSFTHQSADAAEANGNIIIFQITT